MNENDKYKGMLLDDRYELLNPIGEGGMAVVYRAMDRRLNRYVAVKIMRDETAADEEFKRRFFAESQAVAMLSHPNIVAVYDVSHNDQMEYIVMELIAGITLKQYMIRRGKLGWKETVHFSKQIARAIAHAHQRGIIHRDIKPQNIMLLRDGTIKVADFGIAALENEIQENNGQAVGSIHYIAPEQARGEQPDARSDVYSLGVVMYEMLTGEVPYTGDTLAEIAIKHMNAVPKPIRESNPNIPAELEAIVNHALMPKLGERYQTAEELADDLERLIRDPAAENAANDAGESPEPADPAPEVISHPDVKPIRSVSEMSKKNYARRRRRADRVTFLLGSFLLLCLAIGLFVFLWQYWIADIFAPAKRISLPKFVGMNYNDLMNDPELTSLYNFKPVEIAVSDAEPGKIIRQDPKPGRSVMIDTSGIDVTLEITVEARITIPDLTNQTYMNALLTLEKYGFKDVQIVNATSTTVNRDYVISTSPAAGEAVTKDAIVYITVSSGSEVSYVEIPNLVGITEDQARAKLDAAHLSYASSVYQSSEFDPGTVIGQMPEAFTQIEEHAKITLIVSSGPGGAS